MLDKKPVDIPSQFFKTITDKEWHVVMQTGELNSKLCKRLWAMQGRTDKPPDFLTLLFKKEDMLRVFPPYSDMH